MNSTLKNINKIPVRTWRWLGVNDAAIAKDIPEIKPYNKEVIQGNNVKELKIVDINKNKNVISIIDRRLDNGISDELTEFCKNEFNSGYIIEAEQGYMQAEPIILEYTMDAANSTLIDNLVILAGKDSKITIIIKYSTEDFTEAFHNGFTRIHAKENAVVNLVKIQTMNENSINLDAVAALAEDEASIKYISVELGGKNSVTSYKTELLGKNSTSNLDSIYLGDLDRNIDMNYIMTHFGENSISNIDTKGVLMDKSKKIFRGTLDFKRGAIGSKGKEVEYSLLMSTNVRNRSVPILLCGEEDVEGQHAASTGKIDENKLFYLMSRGFSEAEAKKLVIEAAFNPIIDKIPSEEVRNDVSEYIRRRFKNG